MKVKITLTNRDFEEMIHDYLIKHNIIIQKSTKEVVEDLIAHMNEGEDIALDIDAVTFKSVEVPYIPYVPRIDPGTYPGVPGRGTGYPYTWSTATTDVVILPDTREIKTNLD